MTTMAVFFPILLIQETAGQLFKDIAYAIMAAVALSLFVSLTIIPSAAAAFCTVKILLKTMGNRLERSIAIEKSLRRLAQSRSSTPPFCCRLGSSNQQILETSYWGYRDFHSWHGCRH